jgi:alpha-amylase
MVLSQGSYNVQNLPGEQQGERFMVYPNGKRVYRTVPFVNSHDTYRPKLDSTGKFAGNLGVDSTWNLGDELGGNGRHIDPREPRLAAAYAAICAIDGNPSFFFEDLFDIGTTGKRWTHLPSSTADLPIRADLQNILLAHQKLGFKDADYAVPSSLAGADAPFYQKGAAGDHLVIERVGKAIIGITDKYNTGSDNSNDEEVYVTVDASWVGKDLYDYSGAHGITTTRVFNDRRVLIKTAPVAHTINGAFGHGYSVWAPASPGVTISSVNDLYQYLATYNPQRAAETTQEWEMADDLGDSHCNSLGQGGALPANSTNQRIAGKIFVDAGKVVTYKVFSQIEGTDLTATLWDLNGNKLHEIAGATTAASPVTGTFTPSFTGWITVKIRHSNTTQALQKAWVTVAYTAPAVVDTRSVGSNAATSVAIWSGNKGTSDAFNCGNWEEGKMPSASTDVIIPAYASPSPVITSNITVRNIVIQPGANLTVNPGVVVTVTSHLQKQ